MDTRSKIVSMADALAQAARPCVIVTGYFDVLRAAYVREAERARAASLIAVVLPRAGELLPLRARVELAAALRAVDYVVAGPEDLPSDVPAVHLEGIEERLSRELRDRIVSRSRLQ